MQTTESKDSGSTVYLVGVCLAAALGGLLFGYDTGVVNGSLDFVQKKFDLSDIMVGFAAASALVGCIFGAAFAGTLSDRLGRKKVLVLSAVMFLVSAIGTAIPRDIFQFIVFRFIGGLGVGAASITSPMYIAEISPARIRGRMVSVNQFAIVSGMLLVYFVNYFIAIRGDETWNTEAGWRWMFGSESLPAVLFLLLTLLIPESPRWLTKNRKKDRALAILSRVDGSEYAREEMVAIEETIEHESGSLAQLFHPGMRLVLVIGVVLAVLQQVTGINVFLYFGSDVFGKLGGETINAALLEQIVVGATNLIFTVVAIWVVDKLGRKPLMIIGSVGMGISLFAMGLAGVFQAEGLWLLFFVLGYIACFAVSVGPVVWVILSEIFPTKIRGRAMGIATICLWSANAVVTLTYKMMNGNKFLVDVFHHGFPFFIYGSMCIVLILFMWRFVPETKGKSLEEIERMWLGSAR
ncbi:MAG TPA: sugar porter family MFS transporter [Sedimentisphaerales bacterium]|nr:sugar porter family MFS transporter [Sedimentisphaerales bacterium]